MSMFSTGFAPKKDQNGNIPKAVLDWEIKDFFLKVGEEREITFLEDEPTHAWFHEMWVNKKLTRFPCAKQSDASNTVCRLCNYAMAEGPQKDGQNGKSYSPASRTRRYIYTVLDHDKFVGKERTYQDELKLFIFKTSTAGELKEKRDKAGGLAGKTCTVVRGTDKTAACGTGFIGLSKKHDVKEVAHLHGFKVSDVMTAYPDQNLLNDDYTIRYDQVFHIPSYEEAQAWLEENGLVANGADAMNPPKDMINGTAQGMTPAVKTISSEIPF